MIYDYSIAGILLRCVLPFELHVEEESREFLLSDKTFAVEPDMFFDLAPVESISLPEPPGFQMVNSFYTATEEGYVAYHCPGPNRAPHAKIQWSKKAPRVLTGEYVSSMEHLVHYSSNLIDLVGLESFLLQHEALLLHASLVRFEGKALLFSGPSGIGKSTQARLWQEHQGAEILNGDRAAIRRKDGSWTAWGLPYAGSSGIYRNALAPVAGIVVLRQGKENVLHRLTAGDALRCLYPEFMIHRWDPEFVAEAVDLAIELLSQVPVWLLECRPEKEATELLRQMIEKEDAT